MSALVDRLGRTIEYLRLSVTDRCNLRCFYCLPRRFRGFEPPDHWLTADEIERVARAFAVLGVRRLRLTGGEPLARRGLADLAARLAALPGIEDLSLSTNGTLLAQQAGPLRRAGIGRLNVSLDTLRAERFQRITGGPLAPALAGLMAAKAAGFHPIKINMLALKGLNDDEFVDMVEFCLRHDFTLRFIELMPVGGAGQAAGRHYMDLREVRERLARHFEFVPSIMPGGGLPPAASRAAGAFLHGGGPARYVRVSGTALHIGFITPLSQHFCETCNRLRLSADGTLYLCLGRDHRYPLRPLLRSGADDTELRAAITAAVARKPARHRFHERPVAIARAMSLTGG